ncbi:bacitracin ABC transporter ATP-binding protein [Gemmiger sp. An120]|uniref:ABC transporter ATP-binding protein n=1 Tax=Gemmiger sp. An120 TaxID=1965549 RepID=UPI000B3924B8|nr:ABC transporter ATP-binding protein [Gemmiger sp. An120]OUQ42760.1 bacitracin ABC transporter ATP-binding protein [Gemmiger sp. An120]
MNDVLNTTDLTKIYGNFKALDKLNMSVPKQAIYGLVGKNGAGKTTLLRIICGLQNTTSGEYRLYGISSKDKKIVKARQKMGAVIETPAIYPDLSATGNLKEQFRITGERTFKKIPDLLQLVGLERVGHKKAGNFSLGMKQRLGIAMALANNPNFLVLDEPVNGLDPQGIVEMRETLLKLNREYGITILISSHILDELSRIATYYGFIDNGRMVKEISAVDLKKDFEKRIVLEVSNISVLIEILKKQNIRHQITSSNRVEIFDSINISQLTLALAEQGCNVNSIHEQDENLENYFMSLIGGTHHE